MSDIEALKPSNTGWLIADVVADTFAFEWTRTAVDPALLALLADPQWQPLVVYPGEFVEAARVVQAIPRSAVPDKRPLFILLDGTWAEAGKMFRKSPYLDGFPMLSLNPDQPSRYKLRRSKRDDLHCTSEVAALRSGPKKSDGRISDISASMCDEDRQTRSRSNEKTPS
jgi:DTW domain-containing protein YfiP